MIGYVEFKTVLISSPHTLIVGYLNLRVPIRRVFIHCFARNVLEEYVVDRLTWGTESTCMVIVWFYLWNA